MAKKVRGLNLQGIYSNRVLIVTHKDLDGIMSSVAASLALEKLNKDVVIYTDISPKSDKTDEMITDALNGLVTMSMSIFEEVYILDRATCSKEMLVKLYNMGVNKVIHIDHHTTNKDQSMENLLHMIDAGAEKFYRYVGNKQGEEYSACYLTYREFVTEYDMSTTSFNIFKNYIILSDLYDTFCWTKFVDPGNTKDDNFVADAVEYISKTYLTDLSRMQEFTLVTPLDVRPVNMNYIYKFLDDEDFYSEVMFSIKNEIDIQNSMNPVARRFSKIEEDTTKFIKYAYNDAKRADGNSRYDSAIYNMVFELGNGEVRVAEVLFVDKPLDYGASSVAAYRFLAANRDVVLVFRSKEPSYSYSVRSIGDLSTLDISSKLNGGGHLNASGFTLQKSKELYDLACSETKKHVKSELLNLASNTISLIVK